MGAPKDDAMKAPCKKETDKIDTNTIRLSIGVNHGGMGELTPPSKKKYGAGDYITISNTDG